MEKEYELSEEEKDEIQRERLTPFFKWHYGIIKDSNVVEQVEDSRTKVRVVLNQINVISGIDEVIYEEPKEKTLERISNYINNQ